MSRKPKPVAPPPKRSPGRPAHEPTDRTRETVKVMVAGGIQQDAIAGVLGITLRTLSKHYRQEIARGSAEVNMIVVAAHLKRIRDGDMRAIEWWQKARMGWMEKVVVDDARAERPMRVIVELVGDAAPPPPTITIGGTRERGYDASNMVQLVG